MLSKKIKLDATEPSDSHFESSTEIVTKLHNTQASKTITTLPALFESSHFWSRFYDIECRLNIELKAINFLSSNISAVYNPIEYAADLHCDYLRKFLTGPKSCLFIGMNPGPYGMVQTGVPFGSIPAVKDWLKLKGAVKKPEKELVARPVTGMLCKRNEQSGKRFWGLIQEISGEPEIFFRDCFVHNLCPLAFFHESGKNLTPAELKSDERKLLQIICLKYLKEVIDLLSPKLIISIGRYVEDRVNQLYKNYSINETILHKCILHPSPRSSNNANWNVKAKEWMINNDTLNFFYVGGQLMRLVVQEQFGDIYLKVHKAFLLDVAKHKSVNSFNLDYLDTVNELASGLAQIFLLSMKSLNGHT